LNVASRSRGTIATGSGQGGADARGVISVEDLLTRLATVPRRARSFVISAHDAGGPLRVRARSLDLLESHGLVETRHGVRHFDETDLINVDLYAGRGPLTASLHRLWPAMLNRTPDSGPVGYRAEYRAPCPDPGHSGNCEYSMLTPDGLATVSVPPTARGEPVARFDLELPSRWPALPDEAREVLDSVSHLRFVRLPRRNDQPWDDIGFVHRTGLADCVAVTQLLVERGAERGLAMRHSFGLMIAPPLFSIPHYWAEVLVDGTWVPVDPLLINTLVAWNLLDGSEWPPYRSPGTVLYRLGDRSSVVAHHHGRTVPVNVRVTLAM